MKEQVYAVIVAGGKGLRMGGEKPKQFQDLKGRPVLMHTLERFREALPEGKLILVLPEWWVTMWRDLCRQHAFSVDHELVKGGDTRFHSVKNGLDAIRGEEGVVAVHDGVRPFVSVDVIRECVKRALGGACVVPVIAPVESVRLRQDDAGRTQSVDRRLCLLVQTPQVFPLNRLRQAYSQPYQSLFTDDASVVEADGGQVEVVEGNRENIKLTTPFDWAMAQLLCQ